MSPTHSPVVQDTPTQHFSPVMTRQVTASEIQDWIVAYLAELLEVDTDEIETTIPFDRFGLDSSAAIGMTGELEDWLGRRLDPTLLYDYPTIASLSTHLAASH